MSPSRQARRGPCARTMLWVVAWAWLDPITVVGAVRTPSGGGGGGACMCVGGIRPMKAAMATGFCFFDSHRCVAGWVWG
jgi:hypothetical protein